jgi:hypothetical protein
MTPDLVLNELSLTPATDRGQARQRMSDLLQCIAQLGLLGVHGAVRIDAPLDAIELAPEYLVGVWRGDTEVDLDLRRFYASRIGVGPYLTEEEVRSLKGDEEIEVLVDGRASRGCEAAYLLGGIALSLLSGPDWNSPELTAQISRLNADGLSAGVTDVVRHISALEHVDHHRQWIDESLADISDDDDLWTRRDQLFPHLLFAEAVRQELRDAAKHKDRFCAVVKRLRELERYFAHWSGGQFDANGVGSKCTPETPQTLNDNKEALTRSCVDGAYRLFSYHVRFTPGAGRIYIFPDATSGRAHIGYVREKFVF